MEGISFGGILTVVFIILKLIGKISWSWLWVLSPLWLGFLVDILLFATILLTGKKFWNKWFKK